MISTKRESKVIFLLGLRNVPFGRMFVAKRKSKVLHNKSNVVRDLKHGLLNIYPTHF